MLQGYGKDHSRSAAAKLRYDLEEMIDDSFPSNPDPKSVPSSGDMVDAVYEVALDPSRYDELVSQWHLELQIAANRSLDSQSPLADHFERATTILERVHQDDWQADTTDRLPMPELVLSATGRVIEANEGAIALLSARVGQAIGEMDLTQAASASLTDVINQMNTRQRPPRKITDTTTSSKGLDQAPDARVLRINRAGDDRPLVVLLTSTPQAAAGAITLRCAEIVWPDSLGPLLATAFDLTTAECDITQALVAGQNAATIAEHRGTSRETVRTQIREVLAKTGTHSQLELIRMTIGFSMMAQQAEARAGGGSPAPIDAKTRQKDDPTAIVRETIIQVAGGRDLEVVQYGDLSKPPILVFHDEVIGDAFVPALLRVNPDLHFLVPVRYGYGRTDLLPDMTTEARGDQSLMDLTDALQQLKQADTKQPANNQAAAKQKMRLLAHGNGAYFACRFAVANPELCSSITTIAASLPRKANDRSDTTRYASFVTGMAKLAPAMLRFAVQAGFAMYARVGVRRFLQTVYGDVAQDMRVIDNEQHLLDLQHGGRLTLAQGYRGFLHDEQAIVGDWTDLITSLQLPLHILLGDAEAKPRSDRARRLEQQIKQATNGAGPIRVINVPDTGFFLAFSATQVALDTLTADP